MSRATPAWLRPWVAALAAATPGLRLSLAVLAAVEIGLICAGASLSRFAQVTWLVTVVVVLVASPFWRVIRAWRARPMSVTLTEAPVECRCGKVCDGEEDLGLHRLLRGPGHKRAWQRPDTDAEDSR